MNQNNKSEIELKEEIEKEFKKVDETYTWNYKNFVIFVMPIIDKTIQKAKLESYQSAIQKALEIIEKYWGIAIKSLHNTSPKNKELQTTSGKVEERLHILYNRHRENLKELFKQEFTQKLNQEKEK